MSNTRQVPVWRIGDEYTADESIVWHQPTEAFYAAISSHTASDVNEPPNVAFWGELEEDQTFLESILASPVNTLVFVGVVILLLVFLFIFVNQFFAAPTPDVTATAPQRAELAIQTLVKESKVGQQILRSGGGAGTAQLGEVAKSKGVASAKAAINAVKSAVNADCKTAIEKVEEGVMNRIETALETFRQTQSLGAGGGGGRTGGTDLAGALQLLNLAGGR